VDSKRCLAFSLLFASGVLGVPVAWFAQKPRRLGFGPRARSMFNPAL
jgi:hypothetical protein